MKISQKATKILASKRHRDLFTFFCLYIVQAVPMSFFSTAIPVIMRQENFDLSTIGMLQLIKLPWIAKFLWAPMVDHSCHNISDYKRWIFLSEIVYAAFIMMISFFDIHTNFLWIIGLVIASLITSATQDIATDSLAIKTFDKSEKGLVNSMQSMGSFAGTIIGSGVLLIVFKHFGWNMLLPALSLLVLIALIPLWKNHKLKFSSESAINKKIRIPFRQNMYGIITFFTQKGIWRQLIFLFFYYSGIIGILAMLRPYLVDLGYNLKEIGIMSGIEGTSCAFLTAFAAGIIIKKLGRDLSRILYATLMLFATLFFVTFSTFSPSVIHLYIGIFLLWGSYGAATIVVYTTAMDNVRPGHEGTDFTIQIVLTHLSAIFVAIGSGKLADIFGYDGLFMMESCLAGFVLFYTLWAYKIDFLAISKETINQ